MVGGPLFIMDLDAQTKIFDDTVNEMRAIMFSKGNDYANSDRLSNFKVAGAAAGISPERQCLSLIAVKVARLSNLMDKDTVNHESFEDSCNDLANYALLLKMLHLEKHV